MLEVRVLIGNAGEEGPGWEEVLEVTNEETGGKELLKQLEDFNLYLRYPNEKVRELRAILGVIGEVERHNWEKVNLVTLPDGTDEWRCTKCGLREKRLMGRPDKKFKGRVRESDNFTRYCLTLWCHL